MAYADGELHGSAKAAFEAALKLSPNYARAQQGLSKLSTQQ